MDRKRPRSAAGLDRAPKQACCSKGGADAGEEEATRPGQRGRGHRDLLRGGKASSRSCLQQSHHENNSSSFRAWCGSLGNKPHESAPPVKRQKRTCFAVDTEATPWGRGKRERKGSHCFLALGLPEKQGLNWGSERKLDTLIKEQGIKWTQAPCPLKVIWELSPGVRIILSVVYFIVSIQLLKFTKASTF